MASARYAAKHYMEVAQARQATYANTKRKALPLKIGDEVLLATNRLKMNGESFKKLQPRWIGPFVVTKVINSNAVRINSDQMGHKFHPVINVERLKPYYSGMDVRKLDDELSQHVSEIDVEQRKEVRNEEEEREGDVPETSMDTQSKDSQLHDQLISPEEDKDDLVIELDDY